MQDAYTFATFARDFKTQNIAKVFEEALNDMKSEESKSSERLFEIFKEHLKTAVEVTAEGINLHIDHA